MTQDDGGHLDEEISTSNILGISNKQQDLYKFSAVFLLVETKRQIRAACSAALDHHLRSPLCSLHRLKPGRFKNDTPLRRSHD